MKTRLIKRISWAAMFIAICSLCVAILIPSLNKVKKLSQRVVSGTNLKGSGTAQSVYHGDKPGIIYSLKPALDIGGGTSYDIKFQGGVTAGSQRKEFFVRLSSGLENGSTPPMAHGGNTPPNSEAYDAMFFKY